MLQTAVRPKTRLMLWLMTVTKTVCCAPLLLLLMIWVRPATQRDKGLHQNRVKG